MAKTCVLPAFVITPDHRAADRAMKNSMRAFVKHRWLRPWEIGISASHLSRGFKAFRGDVGRDLFSRVRRDGWSFDAELLVIARQRGYRVTEVPVAWEHRAGTKVNLLRDVVGSLVGLASIRMDAFLGRYRTLAALDEPHEATNVGAGSLSTRGEGADATADSAT